MDDRAEPDRIRRLDGGCCGPCEASGSRMAKQKSIGLMPGFAWHFKLTDFSPTPQTKPVPGVGYGCLANRQNFLHRARLVGQRGCCQRPKRDSLCPPCLPSLITEHTEHLSDLCVESLLSTEDAEALTTRGEIFAAREEAGCQCFRDVGTCSHRVNASISSARVGGSFLRRSTISRLAHRWRTSWRCSRPCVNAGAIHWGPESAERGK